MSNIPNSAEANDFKPCFRRRNYFIMSMSVCLITLGFILMTGPSCTMDHFNPDVFSHLRTVIAPTCCFVGYLTMIVGVMLR